MDVRLTNICMGFKNAPVIGSGIFVCDFGDKGGKVNLETLTTEAVYSNGMVLRGTDNIPPLIGTSLENKGVAHDVELEVIEKNKLKCIRSAESVYNKVNRITINFD